MKIIQSFNIPLHSALRNTRCGKRLLYFVMLLFVINGCAQKPLPTTRLVIKGSDTMLMLTQLLTEEYLKLNPGIAIYVEGGGTGSGIKALIRNEIDICTASRDLMADELQLLAEKYNSLGVKYTVAKDALSVFVNPKNPVYNLNTEQIKQIFTCEIDNWSDLGGEDKPITPIIRNPNSGTYLYFKEHILLGDEYCDSSLVRPTTQSILEEVQDNPYSIGYGGIGYIEGVKHIMINGIEPSEQNTQNGLYPISRYLYFIVLDKNNKHTKSFINWVLTKEGQKIVKASGYIPLWEISY
ncbi:MAG: phosphate ABC transporter substrate-binding protein [Melioribacteraceae bacterium]|nr:phosphate ABC transporter substrate-binding protein [Melioribacteraceae bacterium]